MDTLHRENEALRHRLEILVGDARQNEQKQRRFQEMELRLIGANGFRELLDILLLDLKRAFDLDAVSLALLDPEYGYHRMLRHLQIAPENMPGLLLPESVQPFERIFASALLPILASYRPAQHETLFQPRSSLGSVACLPLVRHGRLIGSLNFGSSAADRFTPSMATDFLGRLGSIAAICLENVANQERLKHIGLTDPLTGVHNRRYFDQRLLEEVGRAQRKGGALSCLFLDIDHFKRINDGYGHQAGDRVLMEAAWRIKTQLRLADILARYGGEEFAILLAQTKEDEAWRIADRIRLTIAGQPFPVSETESLGVTLSIGLATFNDAARDEKIEVLSGDLVGRADEALYAAKRSGRNRVVIWERTLKPEA